MTLDTGTTADPPTEPTGIADDLFRLYEARGNGRYGESVTQIEHARQCGAYAMASGGSDALVVAAFFHDIGHLLEARPGPAAEGMAGTTPRVDLRHEDLGADHLARFFGDDVTGPVRLHVAAKRYLCAADQAYLSSLSPASVASLRLQGGPMTQAEMAAFAAAPGSLQALELRRWDDLAKVAGAPTPSLQVFRQVAIDLLVASPER